MKTIRVKTINANLRDDARPDFGRVAIEVNDQPITDDFDLWRALDAAERDLLFVVEETNKYKYIREDQQKAVRAVFENLKSLIMDYVRQEAKQ